ncbi:MAG TPA: hypothetical protein VFE34_15470 [Dongiaceae bacterium]|jgi:hypothetical protein|nr:hypothetical protein [Dongiaceae bacterium]
MVNSFSRLMASLLAIGMPAPAFAADFTTAESAIRSLEEAYIKKDIEAAVAAKDFTEEARLMLQGLDAEFPNDPEMVRMTAEVLELSFRNDIKASGFPNFSELKCSLGETDNVTPTLVKVTERCIFPDGGTSIQHLQVFNGAQGWRVIGVLD